MERVLSIAWMRIAAICMSLLAGCVFVPIEQPPVEPVTSVAEPEAAEPAVAPLDGAAAPSSPAPPPAPPRPGPPRRDRVLVLLPSPAEAFSDMLSELEAQLSARRLDTSVATVDELPAYLAAFGAELKPPAYVVAVGSSAAQAAIDELDASVVFCQVADQEFARAKDVYGVASLPPLGLQLKAWRRLDPSLRRIGLVLSRDEYLLATEARNAAEAIGIELELALASSDQEAIYHFKRMAPSIDGLWLLPDNTVLSARAIREMLDHARVRGVQSLVFTPSLLEWGALLSVTGTAPDLARALAAVVGGLAGDGRRDPIPPITPLSELEARVGAEAAARFGLRPASHAWIERSGER